MKPKGKLIVVSGPSGSGKGTILAKLFERDESLRFSVSATTRAPREGEADGREYFFMTPEKFEKLIADGKMLEWADYCQNYYGTPKEPIDAWRAEGKSVILEIEVEGALQVMEKEPTATTVFILPPSEEELERRLRGRATESDSDLSMRLHKARQEMAQADKYQYQIVNDRLEDAVDALYHIIHTDGE